MDLRYRYGAMVDLLGLPLIGLFDDDVGREYGVGTREKLELAYRARRAQHSIPTASSFLEHLAMAEAILRVPASVDGVVVECGCYKGGSTASLSLASRLAGRRLLVFDSFAGLPEPGGDDAVHHVLRDQTAHTYERGAFSGGLSEVRRNVERFGAPELCEFVPGYFEDTLPGFDQPCVFAFVDGDLTESVKTCVENLWPRLAPNCSLWTHEAHHAEIAELFFDADWWGDALGSEPPGLAGAGSGLGLSSHAQTPIGYAVKQPAQVRVVEQDWVTASG
jgi:O-methyltransferase